MSEPFVVAGCPARNRAWALPRWYSAVSTQTRKPDAAFVLLNDCDDDSNLWLREAAFASAWARDSRHLDYETFNTGEPGYDRIAPRYSTANLAHLRNEWIARCLARWPRLTHLWSVDSDIAPDPNVLERLLSVDEPIVAAVVRNSTQPGVFNFFHGYDADGPRRDGTEAFIVDSFGVPVQATMVGACCLYRREALDKGLRFAAHLRGEDVGLAVRAKELGIPMWVEPTARTRHVQKDRSEWR